MINRFSPNRREALRLGASASVVALLQNQAWAQTNPEADPVKDVHGLSSFGELKYPADFKHFDWVNPEAPKGGKFSYIPSQWVFNQNPQTFNSLNSLILTGDAPIGILGIFAALMVRAWDEPDTIYGQAARSVSIEDGGKLYRFRLREEARFHDGTPLTAEDVAYSINVLRTDGHPQLVQTMSEVQGAEANGPHEAVVRFSGRQARDVPLAVANLPILSKAYYATRPFKESTLDIPLGSGAYKVGQLQPGRFIEYVRVPDWWGANLPVSVGQNNFDTIRVEVFRDRQVAFEGFKGGTYLFREEFTSRVWATGYDFPAVQDGRVKRFELPDERMSGAQGWFFNLRRPQFQDPRVREALIVAFDFEWTNANIMYNTYKRTDSFFENSDFEAKGSPSPEEKTLLEPFRGQIPEEVFGEPFSPPVSDGSGQDRKLLRRATGLLREAGWQVRDGVLKNTKGETFAIEFLDDDPSFEPHIMAFIKNLKLLGINANYRVVDAAQYQSRTNSFDFDSIVRRSVPSAVPGEEMRQYFGSAAAKTPGSINMAGIESPVVDALVEKIIAARSMAEVTTACRALDRVLRAGRYWAPQWFKGTHSIAVWDAFGRPETVPKFGFPFDTTWWWDQEKAARAGVAG